MTQVRLSLVILVVLFMAAVFTVGWGLNYYYRYYYAAEQMKYAERHHRFQDVIHAKISSHWQQRLGELVESSLSLLPQKPEDIPKRLRSMQTAKTEIRRAIYLTTEYIYLAHWKRARVSRAANYQPSLILEKPEFKRAEILEYRDHDYASAISIYEQHWLENPTDFEAVKALARCLIKIENYARGIKLYQYLVEQNPPIPKWDDTPLAITATIQLLQIFKQQGSLAMEKALALEFYRDLVRQKWELSQIKQQLFKKMTQAIIGQYKEDKTYQAGYREINRLATQIMKNEDYVNSIIRHVTPGVTRREQQTFQVLFLPAHQAAKSFLLITARQKNHLILDVHYPRCVEKHLEPYLSQLAQEYALGFRWYLADREKAFSPANKKFSDSRAVMRDFPDLQVALGISDHLHQAELARLDNIKRLFVLGFAVFVALLLIVLFLVIKQVRLNELKSDFVAQVSHELKTPLTALRMLSELLDEEPRQPLPLRRQYYAAMLKESVRLSRLIENLLNISRIERRKYHYHFQQEKIDGILAEAAGIFRNAGRHASSSLQLKLESNASAWIDREAIILMVINLIDNARKYSHPRQAIWLESSQEGNRIIVQVRDKGVGMTRKELRQAFKKFYQVRMNYTQRFKGVGLGLAIVRRIVKAHQGKITLLSEPGKGTTVRIELPGNRAKRYRDGHASQAPEPEPVADKPSRKT